MVMVCDMPTGYGKSSAAINYINEHPENRYVYITPYVSEGDRIIAACPEAKFYKPNNYSDDTGHSKTMDTLPQLEAGRNVATTHAAFLYYTPEIVRAIQDGGYTLIIDESVNILDELKIDPGDLRVFVDAGFINEENGCYTTGRPGYTGSYWKDLLRKLRSRELYRVNDDDEGEQYMYWVMPVRVLLAFREVIVMTYQFQSQDMYYYFEMNNIPFKYIGVVHDDAGYHFNNEPLDVPHRAPGVERFRDLLHICDNPKRNAVGDSRTALSMNWMDTNRAGTEELRKQLKEWFRYDMRMFGEPYRLVGTYCKEGRWNRIKDSGFKHANLAFNYRATNNFSDRRVIAYACNLFLPGSKKTFFKNHGIDIDEDMYALSTMIQFIWRSAIRKGEEIWIYIPSRRMRELLQGWLEDLANGKDPAVRGCPDAREEMHQLLVERGVRIQSAM